MKRKVILTFICFIILVVSNQVIFHFDIKRQYYDAEIINKAGKQRMFSQKLIKLALYADEARNTSNFESKLEDYITTFNDFNSGNYYINHIDLDFYENPYLEELYKTNQLYFSKIEKASLEIINDANNEQLFNNFLTTVKSNEGTFLVSMDKIVQEYQRISEHKIDNFEKMQLIFNATTLLLLIYALFFIIVPLFKTKAKKIADIA
ncbi:type IV pili methyl-accepting chemotaxis transducer N-terminal domain-containing protein [Polaribacter sp. PL03]|uniref:type IV pili methyl-accepting chemotaxis transducer N-terminal domain-containing protein n=1 Tax=Polaribacter sp. PL03 TaxID=3088353 RepID=UPI0029CDD0AD|nr:type IV pili methyl-accepting chemotaxis transducer N-terminal domain-containing protein [Polaribacter sp. PL03]MDX6746500.1 type IV pili methyl-accepting chemotaxis transducer N-terminal domain-containing protein [Polaribacter sp. PL03]